MYTLIMLKVDDRQLKKLSRDLILKRPSQIRGIIRTVLNDQAFATQKQAKNTTIPRNFHNRTTWIASSILVDKANNKKMQSEVGSKKRWKRNPNQDFEGMEQQEKGRTLRRPGISTLRARGGAFSKNVKPSLRKKALGRIRKISTKQQIRQHDQAGNRGAIEIMPSTGIRHGIYTMDRGRTGRTRGTKIRRLRMIVDLSKETVKLKKRPWLEQARDKGANQALTERYYRRAFKRYTK